MSDAELTSPLTVDLPVVHAGDQYDGLADLLPQVWQDVVVSTVEGVHMAVAARAFAKVPGSAPVRAVHDGIASAVYRTMERAGAGAQQALRAVAKATAGGRNPEALETNRAWRATTAVLNGVIGDVLEDEGNPLAIRTAVRVDGADVALSRDGLARAFPAATGRVAVFLHGLVESDESWNAGAERLGTTYPELLEGRGVTPVRVRYNSGRHVSDNAVDVADLLDRLVARWPVPVEQLLLVGHSMGGLVLIGAGDVAVGSGLAWPDLVSDTVLLGTPHAGAPLEKVANAGAWLLTNLPELAPFADILRRRSAGIKDLRHGYVSPGDWAGQDPDGLRSRRANPTRPLAGTRTHHVGATITEDRDHPFGAMLGDLLVTWGSAVADGNPWTRSATVTHLAGANHFDLLNHPDVHILLTNLTPRP